MIAPKPTIEFYGLLQEAYDFFNHELFTGEIAPCMITLQRNKQVMGYFSADRWINDAGHKTHEIALNPGYFSSHTVIEIFRTLAHEMCHLWQHDYGNPSRKSYHNKEWADKMDSIGLVPSHTGQPGGRRTGQKMSDYPEFHGRFIEATKRFLEDHHKELWFDRFPVDEVEDSTTCSKTRAIDSRPEDKRKARVLKFMNVPVSEFVSGIVTPKTHPELAIAAKKKQKVRYSCSQCLTNVWGKPGLFLACGVCGSQYEGGEK